MIFHILFYITVYQHLQSIFIFVNMYGKVICGKRNSLHWRVTLLNLTSFHVLFNTSINEPVKIMTKRAKHTFLQLTVHIFTNLLSNKWTREKQLPKVMQRSNIRKQSTQAHCSNTWVFWLKLENFNLEKIYFRLKLNG